MDAQGNVELDFVDDPVHESELGKVGRTERGRASSVRDEVGTSQVEDETEAIGDDGLHILTALVHLVWNAIPIILVKANRAASVVRITVGVLLCDAHLEQVMGTDLQDMTLHGVHTPGFADNDLKVLVVEELNAFNNRHVLCAGLPRHDCFAVGVEIEVDVPTGDWDLLTSITATVEASPVHLRLVPACHEARGQVDDIDVLLVWPRGPLAKAQPAAVAVPLGDHQGPGLLEKLC
mmetsp:Transcript_89619/g.208754  ORF Transcript_89619/g.208754 Transcript_89619/m.208754 type:complete len:235 (-) Transcript_89619:860-1564(-)